MMEGIAGKVEEFIDGDLVCQFFESFIIKGTALEIGKGERRSRIPEFHF